MDSQSTSLDYGADDETSYHILVKCTFASVFWQSFKVMFNINLLNLHPLTWCPDLLDEATCQTEDCGLIFCGMWAILTARNGRRHVENPMNLRQTCRLAKETACDLICATSVPSAKMSIFRCINGLSLQLVMLKLMLMHVSF